MPFDSIDAAHAHSMRVIADISNSKIDPPAETCEECNHSLYLDEEGFCSHCSTAPADDEDDPRHEYDPCAEQEKKEHDDMTSQIEYEVEQQRGSP